MAITNPNPNPNNPNSKLVCFSFAAYAKSVIDNLDSCNIPILDGLSDSEFSFFESLFGFSFPPDLRAILEQGVPVAPGFPNWRSSSPQQLHILVNLPILGLVKQVSEKKFWFDSWGIEPINGKESVICAKRFLKNVPILVPLYRNFYIPCSPNVAGNPVFYVNGGDVRVYSFDVAGFFKEFELLQVGVKRRLGFTEKISTNAPAWAATAARKIEFWTDVAESGKRKVAARGWWSGELGVCLEDVFWRLRDGGWTEDEVKEMMMIDGGDGASKRRSLPAVEVIPNKESVVWHVRGLFRALLRAGWSREDVVYSLGPSIINP